MANEIDVGGIVMRIRADMSGVKAGVDTLEREMNRMQGSTDKAGAGVGSSAKKMSAAVQESSVAQAAAYGAIAAAATKAFVAVVKAIETGVEASERYKAAIIGLQSVAAGRGIGGEELDAALAEVTDAFFDASAASTAFKNLLSRGYDLKQATDSITRLKDAATFGRQASLGLAEAVISATEGLKNENSILVDNAGVTKNVSVMWNEYARSIGTTAASLTMQQKIEAEYQGIMQETSFQVGDLAKAAETLTGKQAAAAQSTLLLTQAYGQSMTPAVGLVTDVMKGLTDVLTGLVNDMPALVSGVTAGSLAIGAMTIAAKAAQALKALNISLQAAAGGATLFG
ncbi:MAG: hypothetical protein EOM58_09955, partial [Clostridia bacterium]|nr:hypothetical protein [Clostridia bacterium]